jgi:hypothetical protein
VYPPNYFGGCGLSNFSGTFVAAKFFWRLRYFIGKTIGGKTIVLFYA